MKKSTLIFFVVGLILEIVAFPISHADKMLWVLKIVARPYGNAVAGYKKLAIDHKLVLEDTGFSELSSLVMATFAEQNPKEAIDKITVERFEYQMGAQVKFLGKLVVDSAKINVSLSNGQNFSFKLDWFKIEVETLRKDAIFVVAIVLFVLGIILQLLGFIDQYRQSKKEHRPTKPSRATSDSAPCAPSEAPQG